MFNYAPVSDTRKADYGSAFLKSHSVSGAVAKVWSDRSCSKGQQLFEDYGDNRDLIYLMNHGFIPEHNPFSSVPVELAATSSLSEGSVEIREKLVAIIAPQKTVELTANLEILSEEGTTHFHALLRVRDASAADLKRCEHSKSADKVNTCLSNVPIRPESIVDELKAKLASYPTTLEFDTELLRSVKGQPHTAIAIRYRISQKRTLSKLIESLAAPTDSSDLHSLVTNFNRWVEKHRESFPQNKLRAVVDPVMRIGVVASAPIAAEEVYISVHEDILISAANAGKDPELSTVINDLKKRFGSSDDFHSVLFMLLHERSKKSESLWAPYINILPTDMSHNPVMFSKNQLDLLKGSSILPRIQSRIATIRSKFEKVKSLVFEYYPLLSWVTFDDYLWAHLIIDSRSIWWNGKRHLVPLLDLINCAEVTPSMRVHATELNKQTRVAETKAALPFAVGEQVFENYGQPNHIYFLYHGFVLQPNSHDCVSLEMDSWLDEGNTVECVTASNVPVRLTSALKSKFPNDSVHSTLAKIAKKALAGYHDTITAEGATEKQIATFLESEKQILRELIAVNNELEHRSKDEL
eukprot:c12812_g1_i1.p1 GENE.c12812_g1_i1~~c12812_g1_i1.p1  ORF type:complete len:625 (+),score=169.41 c12812_g1_i1:135-1877(+)